MIIKGKTRGHAQQLGRYLLSEKNDRVEVHEVRGFASTDVMVAMSELDAIAKGVKSRQPLFSVVLSPPQNESVGVEVYEQAIDRVEEHVGLAGQPRIVIFHEANGRRHAHAVWSRIDSDHMRVAPLRFYGERLNEVAKRTFLEQGWNLPRGFIDRKDRSPKNYDMELYHQARRESLDPERLKLLAMEAWAVSDNRASFEAALQQRGLYLARGDRRAHVALTMQGEVHSIPRLIGRKAKEVAARLGSAEELRDIEQTRAHIAREIAPALQGLLADAAAEKARAMEPLERQRLAMKAAHNAERRRMDDGIAARWQAEARERAERLRKGLSGLLDHITGRHRDLIARNEREAFAAMTRDRAQRQAMVDAQLAERRELQARIRGTQHAHRQLVEQLHYDLARQAEAERAPEKSLRAEWLDAQRRRDPAPEREVISDRAKWLDAQRDRSGRESPARVSAPDIGADRGFDLE